MSKKQLKEDVLLLLVAVATLLLLGATLFSIVEGWSFLDAFYFVTMTATTVGYGDFIPTTTLSKVITILYSLSIIPFVLYAFSFVAKSQMERVYTKVHHLEHKQKEQEEEIATTEHKLKSQKAKLKEQEEQLDHQENKMKRHQHAIKEQEEKLDKTAKKVSKEHEINKAQAEELEVVEDIMEDALKK